MESVLIAQVTCGDCDGNESIFLEPYGTGWMTRIECENCGTSYDTNIDPVEVGK